jgi:oxygen-dependent protoporphyrinogen oxidase|tara:strand:- start:2994 stop:4370 length:1377 start_codon:yes stop_codon:yes gene_type:complete
MNFIVVGAGLAGLVAAYKLRLLHPEADISVIERGAKPGGLLSGIDYPQNGLYFDQGTHIFQETGNTELDNFMKRAVSRDNLLQFSSGKGDLAGIFFNGVMQAHSHFPDLRTCSDIDILQRSINEQVANVGPVPEVNRSGSLFTSAAARFGELYTSSVIEPMLANVYQRPAESLAGFALLLPGLTRVIVDDLDLWLERSSDERYRAIVGVPDQQKLPNELHHGRRSFYSRKYGTRSFIDGMVSELTDKGVNFFFDAQITTFNPASLSLSFKDRSGGEFNLKADRFVLATGVIGAAKLLGVDLTARGLDKPMPYLLLDIELESPTASDLCFAYGMDKECDWYRLTNYRAFSGDRNDRRITVEIIGDRMLDTETIVEHICLQLRSCGIINNQKILFSAVRQLESGFPVPTMRNMNALNILGIDLSARLPAGILIAGIGARDGLFFQNEVVEDTFRRIEAFE